MSWLDGALAAYRTVQINGIAVARREVINFLSGVTAADDAANGRTNLTVTGGGSGSNVPDKPAAAGTVKYYLLKVDTAGVATWVVALQNMISAAETVAISGGGASTFECGATWTVSGITATPACNAAGVTAATLNDTEGNIDNVFGLGNPLAPSGSPYTQTLNGDTVGIALLQTRDGFALTSNTLESSWVDPWYEFSDTVQNPTGAVLATNTAQLTGNGASAVGTKHVASFGIGTTMTIAATGVPYYKLFMIPHTASLITLADSNNTNIPVTRVVNGLSPNYSNQYSVNHAFDIYATNLINPPANVVAHRAT